MSEPSLKKNFVLSTAYQILLMVMPFITAPYVSRVLTADGIGIYSFTNSIQMYFSMLAALGTAGYGSREIARNRHMKEKRSRLFWEIELLTVITTSLCLVLWGIFIAAMKAYRVYYLVLSLNLVAVMFDISWFYTGMEEFKYTVIPNSLFKILGVISIFTFVKTKDDVGLYILIMALVALLGNVAMWFYLPGFIGRVSWRTLKVRQHCKETLIYFIPTIAASVYTVLDKTLIGLITTDTSENGYYEQATKITNMAKSVTFASLNTLLGSRISLLFAEGRIEEVKSRINFSIDYILFTGVGIWLGIVGVAPRFVPVFFGEGYEPVISLLYCLSPIILIIGVSNCLGAQYYNPAGLRALSAKFIIVGSVINLLLNLILIPRFRSYGAVIASLVAELAITFQYMHYCNGFLHYKTIILKGWKKIISGIAMFCIVRLVGELIPNNIAAVCVEVIAGVVTYCAILLLLKDGFLMKAGLTVMSRIKKT